MTAPLARAAAQAKNAPVKTGAITHEEKTDVVAAAAARPTAASAPRFAAARLSGCDSKECVKPDPHSQK
ncbi:MAG: hypothetical protein ACYCPQ_02945 [Elusimicrobiota bacterium]